MGNELHVTECSSNSVNLSWPSREDTMGDSHEGWIVLLNTTRLCQNISSAWVGRGYPKPNVDPSL